MKKKTQIPDSIRMQLMMTFGYLKALEASRNVTRPIEILLGFIPTAIELTDEAIEVLTESQDVPPVTVYDPDYLTKPKNFQG